MTEKTEPRPVAWMVRNGWVEYQLVGNKKHADAIAADMQKRHDLSGSLAAFRVFPLFYDGKANSHIESDELESALEALVDRCNNGADSCNWEEVIAAEAVLERIYKSRSTEKP